jgi:hypothetical protein
MMQSDEVTLAPNCRVSGSGPHSGPSMMGIDAVTAARKAPDGVWLPRRLCPKQGVTSSAVARDLSRILLKHCKYSPLPTLGRAHPR